MKCFTHPSSDAVGTCKYCCKGVCAECAKDSDYGVVCSERCEAEVKSLKAMVERNRKMVPIAAKTHLRSAVMLFAMALVFIGYGVVVGQGYFQIYMIAFGLIMLLGGGFAVFNSRRIAKL